jgi:hypothetical protein
MASYAGGFDARTLTPADAAVVVGLCAQIEASAASIKAIAAARVADGKEWERTGYRSPAEALADQAGMSSSAARRTLETGRRMADQPEVAQAALAGELSLEQATAVSDGVAANPAKATELIEAAKISSLAELNEAVAKVKADSTDQEERRRARHTKRSLRRWTDRDGAFHAHLYGHPEDGAAIWRMLDPIRRRLNMLRLSAGQPHDTFEALDYDALLTMASVATGRAGELSLTDLIDLGLFPQFYTPPDPNRAVAGADGLAASAAPSGPSAASNAGGNTLGPSGLVAASRLPAPLPSGSGKKLAGSPLRLMIRIDLDALLRGVALEGELHEIAGYGPIPVSVVEDLIATENPFILGILTKAQQVTGVYHHGRHPNAYQRSALDFLHPTCAAQGCPARTGLQYDHRKDYATTKVTAFDLLDRLCPHHHNLKTRNNWALVEGRGKRPFVPPHDPRHPQPQQRPPGPAP